MSTSANTDTSTDISTDASKGRFPDVDTGLPACPWCGVDAIAQSCGYLVPHPPPCPLFGIGELTRLWSEDAVNKWSQREGE
ncbi:MAG: hypothetical protein GY851_21795 [bacterium]|nr:hypothetical protein [bacterium]